MRMTAEGARGERTRVTWSFMKHESVDDRKIEAGTVEDSHRISRRADDGFIEPVEGGVHQNRHARPLAERLDQRTEGAARSRNRLHAEPGRAKRQERAQQFRLRDLVLELH